MIDLLLPDLTAYGVLKSFTRELSAALKAEGVKVRIIDLAVKEDIQAHVNTPPQLTVAFNGMLPDPAGRYLSDFTGLPHVAWLVDAPERFIPLMAHPDTMIVLIDQEFQKESLKHHPKSFFLPHAYNSDLPHDVTKERRYAVLLPGTWMNPSNDEEREQMQAREEALKALEGLPVTLAGNGSTHRGFDSLGALDWDKMRETFEETKLVLQVTPKIKSGGHERVFEALAAGALPITTPNAFLKAEFPSVPQYHSPEELRQMVEELLNNEEERVRRVQEALPRLHSHHSWNHRAKALVQLAIEHLL